jgi:hypothetical protein
MMTVPRLARKSVSLAAANTAHEELTKFVESRDPGAVNKRLDIALNFDSFLNHPDLQNTGALVRDFLQVSRTFEDTISSM